jgi:hypothetical protein
MMIDLDPSLLAPEITYLVMLRGAQVPPLMWTERRQELGRQHLGQMNDRKLFGRGSYANAEMAHAVRALLYLWNGWLKETVTAVTSAPEKERQYIVGLCQRQAGNPTEAKVRFQALAGHPILRPLGRFATEHLKGCSGLQSEVVIKFGQILESRNAWEPSVFTDIFEAARTGKIDESGADVIRALQCREWEILFRYCYEVTTGEPLVKAGDEYRNTIDRQKMRERRREQEQLRKQKAKLHEVQREKSSADPADTPRGAPRGAGPGPDMPDLRQPPAPNTFALACPACNSVQRVPNTARGHAARCAECKQIFGVPKAKAKPVPAGKPGS